MVKARALAWVPSVMGFAETGPDHSDRIEDSGDSSEASGHDGPPDIAPANQNEPDGFDAQAA